MIHPIYLPFSEQQILSHFAEVRGVSPSKRAKYLRYYMASIGRYADYCQRNPDRKSKSLREMRLPCQVEKDERFWVAASMMTIFHSQNRTQEFISLLRRAYGDEPPVEGVSSWNECVSDSLYLYFEANLPSPPSYKSWLQRHLSERQIIPYLLDGAFGKTGTRYRKNLEGATEVDALLLNSDNGFALMIEAKVVSDISCEITYDLMRNQIARNIDVMLERNDRLCHPLNRRDPAKTLFLLVTPRLFKDIPKSHLYGFKFNEYKSDPSSLGLDLPHRTDCDWKDLSKRLGWLTWEDFRDVNKDCCKWLA